MGTTRSSELDSLQSFIQTVKESFTTSPQPPYTGVSSPQPRQRRRRKGVSRSMPTSCSPKPSSPAAGSSYANYVFIMADSQLPTPGSTDSHLSQPSRRTPPPKRFAFVSVRQPSKRTLQTTRKANAEARAHVTKEFHRNARVERAEKYGTSVSPGPEIAQAQERSDSDEGNRSETRIRRKRGKVGGRQREIVEEAYEEFDIASRQRVDANSNLPVALIRPGSSITIRSPVSSFRRDPFQCLPFTDTPALQDRILDFAQQNTWTETVVFPGRKDGFQNPVIPAWMAASREHPVVLNAFMYGAATQMSAIHRKQEISKEAEMTRFKYYHKTITLIGKHLRELDHDTPPFDALLMAVMIMMIHGRVPEQPQQREIHPESPLARQQFVHVYGRIEVDEKHLAGFLGLIERKQGIKNIRTYGMAECMAL
jgi:hypothetical protein